MSNQRTKRATGDDAKACDHEWEFHDDSFDHEFGTERIHYWVCEKCGESTDKAPKQEI